MNATLSISKDVWKVHGSQFIISQPNVQWKSRSHFNAPPFHRTSLFRLDSIYAYHITHGHRWKRL